MSTLDNFLTSGHSFSKNENLRRFRFSLLNSLLLIATFFTLLNYIGSVLNFVPFAPIYEVTLLFYMVVCLSSIYLLRKGKSLFIVAVNLVVFGSLILFYMALFVVSQDEFRLIWFFLVVFASFVLIGKKYGILLMLFILISILIINKNFELGFSDLAQFTFFNSFLVFAAFSYFFLEKIEKDSLEFKDLNSKLKQNFIQERQQREEQEQMLLRQCRMANMGEMLDSIAHQWRQPLMHINSILLNMDVALESKQKNKNYLESKIHEVASLTTHMSQTIEDFRGLFKQEKDQVNFLLDVAINDVLAIMKNGFNNIDVNYTAEKELSIFEFKGELIQVIIILLSNAVEILNSRDIENKQIIIKSFSSNEDVFITIEDNAKGITSKNLNMIFDPYFTTKEQSGGTGLGLYIAKIIVEHKMAGEITVHNTSVGAKFSVRLSRIN